MLTTPLNQGEKSEKEKSCSYLFGWLLLSLLLPFFFLVGFLTIRIIRLYFRSV